MERIYTGINLGSHRVLTVVGSVDQDNRIKIKGFGVAPSHGVKEGQIVNIERATQSIKESVALAEKMAGLEIKSAFIGITGKHIMGISSTGFVAVTHPDEEIKAEDVENALRQAKAISIPMGREVIYVHPNYYRIDGQGGIKDPVGMMGVRLEVEAYILTAQSTILKNIERAVLRAGIKPLKLLFQPIAASYAVLGSEEMEQGTVLVDIGFGTTDIAIWYEENLVHTAVIPLGGDLITNDIAHLLKTSKNKAEEVKIKYGSAWAKKVKEDDQIKLEGLRGNRTYVVERKFLAKIIEARVEEILKMVKHEIMKSGYAEKISAGVVLVGGSALLRDLPDFAEEVLNYPVFVGRPRKLGGLVEALQNPSFASAVGLVRMGHHVTTELGEEEEEPSSIKDFLSKMWQFIKENF